MDTRFKNRLRAAEAAWEDLGVSASGQQNQIRRAASRVASLKASKSDFEILYRQRVLMSDDQERCFRLLLVSYGNVWFLARSTGGRVAPFQLESIAGQIIARAPDEPDDRSHQEDLIGVANRHPELDQSPHDLRFSMKWWLKANAMLLTMGGPRALNLRQDLIDRRATGAYPICEDIEGHWRTIRDGDVGRGYEWLRVFVSTIWRKPSP